ncbi:hypothetical protein YC2023_008344 [Brassica napus]
MGPTGRVNGRGYPVDGRGEVQLDKFSFKCVKAVINSISITVCTNCCILEIRTNNLLGSHINEKSTPRYIARIQHATDVARSSSIDKDQHTSIDVRQCTSIDSQMPTLVDNIPPRPRTMKSQENFHTREEIDQLVEGIYRALETTEERLDGRCDDIYFPMDLEISALTSKIEAIQGELVEIQSYIARRPEASSWIGRHNKKSTDINQKTSVDDATNRGRLVPKMTSDMSDTHYHGEEISADTYATLRRHQFNLESLEERLQRMENTTATMKEKWRRGDEAMRDFTGTWFNKRKEEMDTYFPTSSSFQHY